MKKRIITFILTFLVSAAVVADNCRPARAEIAAATVVTIGVLAWQLIGVMSGDYSNATDAISWCIQTNVDSAESFFDACVNPDSEFQTRWKSGYTQICSTLSDWLQSGAITIEDGKARLTYNQYLELINQSVGLVAKPDISFDAGYNYYFLSGDLHKSFSPVNLPKLDEFYADSVNGQSYAPVYYSKDKIVFASTFFLLRNYNNGKSFVYQLKYFAAANQVMNVSGLADSYNDSLGKSCADYNISFSIRLDYCAFNNTLGGTNYTADFKLSNCFVFENGGLSFVPISDVDTSDMCSGLITTTGDYLSFINSVNGYTVTDNPVDIDDLSDIVPDDTNPDLVIDTNPDIPIPDAVTVDNVPISDYKTKTDIDIPSVIIDKFPFCVPFDFMRIISVLAAEPQAPVIRMPISTNPDNITPFDGNQTISNIPEGFEPMFEIDEEIVLDLSCIPLIQPICYTVFIVGFVVMLILITPKMINH